MTASHSHKKLVEYVWGRCIHSYPKGFLIYRCRIRSPVLSNAEYAPTLHRRSTRTSSLNVLPMSLLNFRIESPLPQTHCPIVC